MFATMNGEPSVEIQRNIIPPVDAAMLGHDLLSAIHLGELALGCTEKSSLPYVRLSHEQQESFVGMSLVIEAMRGVSPRPHYVNAIVTEEEYQVPTHTDHRTVGLVKGVMLMGVVDIRFGEGFGKRLGMAYPGDMFIVHNERVPDERRIPHSVNPISAPRITLLAGWADIVL